MEIKGAVIHQPIIIKCLLLRRSSYKTVGPQTFRIGDIVEVQMSFVGIPLKGQNFKMLSVLRSIALLDGTFSRVTRIHVSAH
jgi:hypothetical protein